MARATGASPTSVGVLGSSSSAPGGMPKIDAPKINASVQMAVPEPVRAMVRAAGTSAASVDALGAAPGTPADVPKIDAAWAPPAGVPSLKGENREA